MTQDEIIRMALEAGFGEYMGLFGCDQIEHFAAQLEAHVKEKCAKVCEGWVQIHGIEDVAAAIRSRGEK